MKNSSQPKINFTVLDGLRGIAATYVVINHSRGFIQQGGAEFAAIVPMEQWSLLTKIYYAALQFTSLGKEFVVFFFVLSGFSIAHSLSKNGNVLPFYKRRIIRLYPPFILALGYAAFSFWIVSILAPHLVGAAEYSVFSNATVTFKNLLYIPTGSFINQFWSLSHEVIFYIIIPFFFLYNLKLYFILSLLFYLGGWVYKWNGMAGDNIISMFLFDYNVFFAIGIYIYKQYPAILTKFIFSRLVFFSVCILMLILSVVLKYKLGDDNRVTLFLFCILSLIMLANFLHWNITNRLFQFLGNLSYTIYITHIASIYLFIVLMNKIGLMDARTTSNGFIWPGAVVFSILLSIPLYLIAEKPTRNLLKKLR